MKALFCGIYVIASDAKSVLLTLSRESTKHYWLYNEKLETKTSANSKWFQLLLPQIET